MVGCGDEIERIGHHLPNCIYDCTRVTRLLEQLDLLISETSARPEHVFRAGPIRAIEMVHFVPSNESDQCCRLQAAGAPACNVNNFQPDRNLSPITPMFVLKNAYNFLVPCFDFKRAWNVGVLYEGRDCTNLFHVFSCVS